MRLKGRTYHKLRLIQLLAYVLELVSLPVPHTWVDGEFVRAGLINNDLRDLISALKLRLPPIGAIRESVNSTLPAGWFLCDGSAISRTTYSALFALIGTTYGIGNGSTTFNLPDLSGVFPMHTGGGHALAARGTQSEVTLGTGHMPSHNHVGGEHEHAFTNVQAPVNFFPAEVAFFSPVTIPFAEDMTLTRNYSGGTTGSAGGGDAFSVMNSYVAVKFYIKAE